MEEWMFQCLTTRVSIFRVDNQHLFDQFVQLVLSMIIKTKLLSKSSHMFHSMDLFTTKILVFLETMVILVF